jgi:hypothetical protein
LSQTKRWSPAFNAAIKVVEIAAMGVEVRGGRVKHRRTVHDGELTKPFWAFVSRPAVNQSGFRFLRIN